MSQHQQRSYYCHLESGLTIAYEGQFLKSKCPPLKESSLTGTVLNKKLKLYQRDSQDQDWTQLQTPRVFLFILDGKCDYRKILKVNKCCDQIKEIQFKGRFLNCTDRQIYEVEGEKLVPVCNLSDGTGFTQHSVADETNTAVFEIKPAGAENFQYLPELSDEEFIESFFLSLDGGSATVVLTSDAPTDRPISFVYKTTVGNVPLTSTVCIGTSISSTRLPGYLAFSYPSSIQPLRSGIDNIVYNQSTIISEEDVLNFTQTPPGSNQTSSLISPPLGFDTADINVIEWIQPISVNSQQHEFISGKFIKFNMSDFPNIFQVNAILNYAPRSSEDSSVRLALFQVNVDENSTQPPNPAIFNVLADALLTGNTASINAVISPSALLPSGGENYFLFLGLISESGQAPLVSLSTLSGSFTVNFPAQS